MADKIEVAKTGRATCRTCKTAIAKGELRFGEEVPNAFAEGESTFQWHHLPCVAQKKPSKLKAALAAFEGEVPNRAELDKAIEENAAKEKPEKLPYAERASTGRAKCLACEQAIAKGELRVAVEREIETAAFARAGAGYLHPACAIEHTKDAELLGKVLANSHLSGADQDELKAKLKSPAGG